MAHTATDNNNMTICDSLVFGSSQDFTMNNAFQFSGPTWSTPPASYEHSLSSGRDSSNCSPVSNFADVSTFSPGEMSSSPDSSCFTPSPPRLQGFHQSAAVSELSIEQTFNFDFNPQFESYPALYEAATADALSPQESSLDSEGGEMFSSSSTSDMDLSPSGVQAQFGDSTTTFWEAQNPSTKTQKPKRKRVLNRTQRSEASVRERRRMVTFNSAFEALKKRIPGFAEQKKKRLSRIDTLRCAIDYIAFLSQSLEMGNR